MPQLCLVHEKLIMIGYLSETNMHDQLCIGYPSETDMPIEEPSNTNWRQTCLYGDLLQTNMPHRKPLANLKIVYYRPITDLHALSWTDIKDP